MTDCTCGIECIGECEGKPIEQVIAESPELQAFQAEVRAKHEQALRAMIDRELKFTMELQQRDAA